MLTFRVPSPGRPLHRQQTTTGAPAITFSNTAVPRGLTFQKVGRRGRGARATQTASSATQSTHANSNRLGLQQQQKRHRRDIAVASPRVRHVVTPQPAHQTCRLANKQDQQNHVPRFARRRFHTFPTHPNPPTKSRPHHTCVSYIRVLAAATAGGTRPLILSKTRRTRFRMNPSPSPSSFARHSSAPAPVPALPAPPPLFNTPPRSPRPPRVTKPPSGCDATAPARVRPTVVAAPVCPRRP